MKIEYPSDQMKEQSIRAICEQTKVKRKNVFLFLMDTYREIGIKVIFRKSIFPYMLASVIYVSMFALLLTGFSKIHGNEEIFANVLLLFFFFSPSVIQLSELLYYIYVSPSGVLEYQNSYKYTAYQLSLLRMPLFSFAAMGINCVMAIFWCSMNGIGNVSAFTGLIACSVFLYSIINAALFNRWKRFGLAAASLVWIVLNGILVFLNAWIKIALFETVPVALHLAAAIVFLVIFVKLIETYYLKPACLSAE